MESEAQATYAKARAGLSDGVEIAVLGMADHATWMVHGAHSRPQVLLKMELGIARLIDACFSRTFPSAAQLEDAIALVEDHIMQQGPVGARSMPLHFFDSALYAVAEATGFKPVAGKIALDLNAVEQMFARLVEVVFGGSAAYHGIPHEPAFAARLLILREVLHHTPFKSIVLMP